MTEPQTKKPTGEAVKPKKTQLGCLELLLVIFILGSLGYCLLPTFQNTRETARCALCCYHQKMILAAMNAYRNEHGILPPLYTIDKDGKPLHSWRVLLLPYFEKLSNSERHTDIHTTEIYEKIRLDEPWDSEYNKEFHKETIELYRCPNNSFDSFRNENCNYSRFTDEKPLPELTRNGEKHFWAIVDMEEPFCWMNPMADVSFDKLLQNVEQIENEQSPRIYLRHSKAGWLGIFPVVNIGWLDGKITSVPEKDLPKLLKSEKGQ